MPNVEDDTRLRAPTDVRLLNYVFDRRLGGGRGGFRYVFDQGSLQCSYPAQSDAKICLVSRHEPNNIRRDRPSFVYLDCGCWVDNSDGKNTQRRDFGLVCGPHVYSCVFVGNQTAPRSRIPSVQRLFSELAQQGCGVTVRKYDRAHPPMALTTPNDPTLYLFLGDLHLPPVSWFYNRFDVGFNVVQYDPPVWLAKTTAMRCQPNDLLRNYYSIAQYNRECGIRRVAKSRISSILGNPDIFRFAGNDLVRFLDALSNLSPETKRLLHFIQTGDMLEMWAGREYQFRVRGRWTKWLDRESPNRTADWALEIMIQNTPVFEAFRRLQNAGLAEIKFLWGNHDAYLKKKNVTEQLGLPDRDSVYINQHLYVEHGHRFDPANFDEVPDELFSGPTITNLNYYAPCSRSLEPYARDLKGDPPFRVTTMRGAMLIYLYQRYDEHTNPFSIYVLGHTHNRFLQTCDIRVVPKEREYDLHL